jgi:hypothetical protein
MTFVAETTLRVWRERTRLHFRVHISRAENLPQTRRITVEAASHWGGSLKLEVASAFPGLEEARCLIEHLPSRCHARSDLSRPAGPLNVTFERHNPLVRVRYFFNGPLRCFVSTSDNGRSGGVSRLIAHWRQTIALRSSSNKKLAPWKAP